MDRAQIENLAISGMYYGAALAVVPVAATTLVACSKIIVVELVIQVALRILNLDSMIVPDPGFVEVPMMWTFSYYSALAGAALFALSAITCLAMNYFPRVKKV